MLYFVFHFPLMMQNPQVCAAASDEQVRSSEQGLDQKPDAFVKAASV